MRKTKVLIVDDYAENIRALSELIAREDIEVVTSTNANDALELIFTNDFGLLLLDVQMPGTNGFELARIVRSVGRYRSLPIIFVTAEQPDFSFIFNGYESGAVDLLFKPLDPHIVRAKVHLFVELAEQRAVLSGQVEELERLRKESDKANKLLEQTLAEVHQAKVAADAASAAKSAFLANMSHEIRTPLGAIMGFAELCQQKDIEAADLKSYTQVIHRNSTQVLKLIDDILDLAKVEAGKVSIEKLTFSLGDMLNDLYETLGPRAREKGLDFSIRATTLLPEVVVSDPVRIRQVLLNAVGNAIKFTEKGQVCLEVGLDKAQLVIRVIDTGSGITESQAKQLFQKFQQADVSTTRKYGGTGLGLVLNRELCRLLGGDYILEKSIPGTGSVFRAFFAIEIPEGNTSASNVEGSLFSGRIPSTEPPSKRLCGFKILIVDDSVDNQRLMSIILEREGALTAVANNGKEAVERALRDDFDAVLMDIQMPEMDGYRAFENLRGRGYGRPVIALTAHALREEVERAHSVGFHSFLSKPVVTGQVIETIRKAVAEAKGAANNLLEYALVIEDDEDIRDLMSTVLEDMGLNVARVGSGQQAFDHLDVGPRPQIIFCDLSLPDIAGADLIKRLKADQRLMGTKIAIVSGRDNVRGIAKESGADYALQKPISLAEIENLVIQQKT